MMTEERTRFEVLLESIETKVNVIAEGHGALVERLDRMERRFETRFDGLETKVDKLEVFASDAQGRLKRIETHLQLKRASRSAPRHAATGAAPKR
jgi:flavorubredoxin